MLFQLRASAAYLFHSDILDKLLRKLYWLFPSHVLYMFCFSLTRGRALDTKGPFGGKLKHKKSESGAKENNMSYD